jgi:glycerophosphoryl diester phosphodiesterase
MTAPRPCPWPRWIAHRGAGKLAPENTLAAFRLGARHGYRAYECDVKLSADGVPFLLHDATLERTTNASGIAGERTWAELSQLDAGSWHGREHAGEPLPTLQAVAAFCHANHHALNIEIKPTPGTERHTGEVVAREAARLWAARAATAATPPPPLLSSFEPAALEGARVGAPELPRALLIDSLVAGWFESAQALGCVAVVANHTLYRREMVERLHGAGLWALCYTVNDEAAARALLDLGLDGLITDAVDCLSPAGGSLD